MTKIYESGRNVKAYLQEMVLPMIAAPVDSMTLRSVVQIIPLYYLYLKAVFSHSL